MGLKRKVKFDLNRLFLSDITCSTKVHNDVSSLTCTSKGWCWSEAAKRRWRTSCRRTRQPGTARLAENDQYLLKTHVSLKMKITNLNGMLLKRPQAILTGRLS